jgi:NADH:ubiquinone oxidoreductase subunit 6 (subunit J)
MMVAIVRPDSSNFPLFLHVLGAVMLVGSVAATATLAGSSQRFPWLRRIAFRTWLAVVIPAWLVMRLAGQWADSREPIGDDSTWLGIGYLVGDAGVLVLIVTAVFAWMSTRRPERGWPGKTVAVLAGLYLVALLVAMFAMSGKPGS